MATGKKASNSTLILEQRGGEGNIFPYSCVLGGDMTNLLYPASHPCAVETPQETSACLQSQGREKWMHTRRVVGSTSEGSNSGNPPVTLLPASFLSGETEELPRTSRASAANICRALGGGGGRQPSSGEVLHRLPLRC